MEFLQLNFRLRCHSKLLLAQLEIVSWKKGILLSVIFKLTRHRMEHWIKIKMKVNNITNFHSKQRYQPEIKLAQSWTTLNLLGFVIKLTLVWQHCKSYLTFMFINQFWDDNFSWRPRRYFTTVQSAHLTHLYSEKNTESRTK